MVDIVFKSQENRDELYRVVLKKALKKNIEALELLENGNLATQTKSQKPVIDMVLEVLDESKSGLIPLKEL